MSATIAVICSRDSINSAIAPFNSSSDTQNPRYRRCLLLRRLKAGLGWWRDRAVDGLQCCILVCLTFQARRPREGGFSRCNDVMLPLSLHVSAFGVPESGGGRSPQARPNQTEHVKT